MDNLEQLLSERDTKKREPIIEELSNRGSQIVLPILNLLESNPHFHVYSNAIDVLGKICSEEAVQFLLKITTHESGFYREQAILALGNCLKKQKSVWDTTKQEQIFNALISRITDTYADAREAVVIAISYDLNPNTIELLVTTFASEYEQQGYFIQDEILLTLKAANIDIIPIFNTLLQKLAPLERIAALDILEWLDTEESNALIKEHYQREVNSVVRRFLQPIIDTIK